jgi:hypothetical protein
LKIQHWRDNGSAKIHRLIWVSKLKTAGYGVFLITSKALDARRRGATTEAYGGSNTPQGGGIEGNAADDALMVDQGREMLLQYGIAYGINSSTKTGGMGVCSA